MTQRIMLFILLISVFILKAQEGFFKKITFDTTAIKAGSSKGVYQAQDGHLWLLNSNNEYKSNDFLSTLSKVDVFIDPIISNYLTINGSAKNPYILAFAEGEDRSKYFFIHLDDDPVLNGVNSTILFAKFDENFVQQWVVNITPKTSGIYQFTTDSEAEIIILPNGDVITQYSNFQVSTQLSEKVIFCFGSNGQIKWSKTLKDRTTQNMNMVYRLPTNEIIWSGYSFNNITAQSTVKLYHINPANGELKKLYAIQGLVSQVPVSMHLTTLNRLIFLTSGNTVITTDGLGALIWAFNYRDNEESRARMYSAIPMNANALGIMMNRGGYLGSEVLKIDSDGDVLLSRRYHSFTLAKGPLYPGFSNNEIYASAQTQNADGIAQNPGMVHLHDDLSVTPCEKQAFCFVKSAASVNIANLANDFDNYILNAATITIPAFEWKKINFQSEVHCVLGERPQATFISPDTICVGEVVNFMDLKNQNADTSLWMTIGGNPDRFFGKGPPKLSYNIGGTYTIRHMMKAGCLVDTFEKKIVVLENPKFNLPDSVFLCPGSTGIQNLSITNVTNFKWDDGITTIDRTFNTDGSYVFHASNLGFCSKSDTVVAKITQLNADFNLPESACNKDSINLLAQLKIQNPSQTKYEWSSTSDGGLVILKNDAILWNNTGSFDLKLKVTLQGCEAEITKTVKVYDSPSPIQTTDTMVCNDVLEIPITATNATSWKWGNDDTSRIKKISEPGIYQYSLANEFCKSQHQIKVGFLDFSGSILADSIYCLNDKKVIDFHPDQANFNGKYSWTYTQNGKSENFTTKNFELNFTETGSHSLNLKIEKDGCMSEFISNIKVTEIPEINFGIENPANLKDTLHIKPTVIPSGASLTWKDGFPEIDRVINKPGLFGISAQLGNCFVEDVLEVRREEFVFFPNIMKKGGEPMNIHVADPNINVLELLIFDRYGNIMFRSIGEGWDGADVVQGVYTLAIRLQFSSGEETWVYGDITVVE